MNATGLAPTHIILVLAANIQKRIPETQKVTQYTLIIQKDKQRSSVKTIVIVNSNCHLDSI